MSEDDAVTAQWGDPDPARASAVEPALRDWSYYVTAPEFARGFGPPPGEPMADRVRRNATAFLGAALLLPLAGAPVALLWRAVTPKVGIARTASGPQPTAGESNQFFAIDGWFLVVTVAAGLLLGVVAWRFLRGRGLGAPVGIAVGGLAAAAVTAAVGARLVVDSYMYGYCTMPDLECSVYDGTMTLRVPGAIVAWPVAMLVSFAVMTLAKDRDPGP